MTGRMFSPSIDTMAFVSLLTISFVRFGVKASLVLSARLSCSQQRSSTLVAVCRIAVQRFGVILAANDCATIFPFRTTNVSVAAWYELSAVSALHKM